MPCRCRALGLERDPIQGLVMGRQAALSREDHSRALCLSSRDGFVRGSRPLRRLRCPPPPPGRGAPAQVRRPVSSRAGPWAVPAPSGCGAHLLDLLLLFPLNKSAQSEASLSPATLLRSPRYTPSWRNMSRGAVSGKTAGGGGARSAEPW